MAEHRYILEPYKGMGTRYTCPSCGKQRKFAIYIDTENDQQLGDRVGKCERSDNCSYHYTPKQYFADNGIIVEHSTTVKEVEPAKPASLIDENLYSKSLRDFDNNHFVTYLRTLFDNGTVERLIKCYNVGTSKHWPGSTVFWQVDSTGKIRTGKIMQYDAATGKRVKVPFERITWVHKVTKAKDFVLKQCLFGEHLLSGNKLPVAVVESEKTAIIAAGYLPQFTWVAAGNKQGLSIDKCNALQQHAKTVILYPDLNAYTDWLSKARLYKFKISDLLEKKASQQEKEKGLDLADYLIQFDIKDFLSSGPEGEAEKPPLPDLPVTEQNQSKPDLRSGIAADLLDMRQQYQDLEDKGLIPDEHRSYIGTLWQGVMIYKHHPPSLKLYTDPLNNLRSELSKT